MILRFRLLHWVETGRKGSFNRETLRHVELFGVIGQHFLEVELKQVLDLLHSLLSIKSLLLRPEVLLVHVSASPQSSMQRDFLVVVVAQLRAQRCVVDRRAVSPQRECLIEVGLLHMV